MPTVSCTAEELPRVSWPLHGQVSRDFAVIAYLDQDPTDGVRDFMGHAGVDAVTYDGHDGVDIDIGGHPAGIGLGEAGLDAPGLVAQRRIEVRVGQLAHPHEVGCRGLQCGLELGVGWRCLVVAGHRRAFL